MKLFLDTANLEAIKKYASWGLVDGVTTNPSLIAKEGVPLEKRIKEICKVVKGAVSTEVLSTDVEGMLKEARVFKKWAKNIYVKLPMTPEGLQATQILSKEEIRINITLVFSAAQALLAAKAGAAFVSPFIGRLDDIGHDGMQLIEEIVQIYRNYDFKTEILVASIRLPRQVTEAAMVGADICTVPPDIYDKLVRHPLTDAGIKKFLEDAKKAK
ncbi:fructose-6-phosphate aldolase [Candidatus Peregrinibacteria bacterium]|nr:fructose-6-phosphate aldolase [Candidatus Peregrinibacteria bacterium]